MKTTKNITEKSEGTNIYIKFMSEIIKQIPDSENLNLLLGTSDGQASFYFKSATTKEVNSSLYNNKIAKRVQGKGSEYGVNQAQLVNDSFTNAYLKVYSSIRYQLSKADELKKEKLVALTHDLIDHHLVPVWNKWVKSDNPSDIPLLPTDNSSEALLMMTDILLTQWINPAYIPIVEENPSYPYLHTNNFNEIFSRIPESAPEEMGIIMQEVLKVEGDTGYIISQMACATQTLSGIINNLRNPTTGADGNGGMLLTGSNSPVPGLVFTPKKASQIEVQLSVNPPDPVLEYCEVFELNGAENLFTEVLKRARIDTSNFQFSSFKDFNLKIGSLSQDQSEDFTCEAEIRIKDPTYDPIFDVNPLPYDPYTRKGWFLAAPIKEAVANISNSDVTGYVFSSIPLYDFNKGGDFGFINSMVFSQFMEYKVVLKNFNLESNNLKDLEKAGIDRIKVSFENKYEFDYSYSVKKRKADTEAETGNNYEEIIIWLNPAPPGYIPPSGGNITNSLSGLVAVGVEYPIA